MTPVALLGKKKKTRKEKQIKTDGVQFNVFLYDVFFLSSWNNIHGRVLDVGQSVGMGEIDMCAQWKVAAGRSQGVKIAWSKRKWGKRGEKV